MASESNKEYSVNWKNHMSHVRKAFDNLLTANELIDVTLCCEGRKIGAHKMLLSACSGYFRDTFKELPCQHPVIILYGVEYSVLSDILRFIYNGEVSVDTSKLDSFLKMAQLLQISGLTENASDSKVIETSNVEHSDNTASDLGMEETFAEPTTSTSFKTVKRIRTKEGEGPQYKIQKQDNDTNRQNDNVLISDVKCEPSEVVSFEDPLEDPLQSDHSYDSRQLYGNATEQSPSPGEEEMKIDVEESQIFERFGNQSQPVQKLIPKNTLKTKNYIWSSFKAFCQHRKYTLDQSTSTEKISEILADWGLNMRKADGSDYKEGAVKTIWNITAKMIQELFYDQYKIKFDPFRDIEFKKARDSRDIKRRQLRCCPEKRKVSSIIFTETERHRIYTLWDENTPTGLQRKFFHIAGFELVWKGREVADCLTYYFRQEFDELGVFTGRVEYNPSFGRTSNESGASESRWLVANSADPNICPVRLLLKLLDKRTAYSKINTDRLFLTPNPYWNRSETSAWYKGCPVGKNQIASWTKEAAEKIGIDTKTAKITTRSNCPTTIDVEESQTFKRFGEQTPVEKVIPKNTIKSKNFIWTSFKAFCQHRQYTLDHSTSTAEISEILADWGLNMRKANGTDYKETVVKTIWNTTAKMLQEMFFDKYKVRFDPFRDIEFQKARDSRDIKRRQLRSTENRNNSSTLLSEIERHKMYTFCDENTPSGLQRKFFHIARFELAWKGREAADCLTYYFRQEFDHCGEFTGRVEYNPIFAGTSDESTCSESRWLVSNSSDPNICPVRLLLKLLEKRTAYGNINTDRLLLSPNPNWNKSETSAWYKDCPVGKNQIASWTKEATERI